VGNTGQTQKEKYEKYVTMVLWLLLRNAMIVLGMLRILKKRKKRE
jgi:hypothetical protein